MIRYVLGGVALAATGYGLKRHIEACNVFTNVKKQNIQEEKEELNHVKLYDDEFEIIPELKKSIENYEDAKKNLRQSSLRELKSAISEINNIDKQEIILNLDYVERYDFKSYSDELIEEFENYTKILQDIKNYIDKNLDKLDLIIIATDDYSNYEEDDKNFVDRFISICTILDKIENTNITNDKETIVREIKRGYGKLNKIIY
ncbi:hypothetical protein CPG37_08845 [Malaciobacter canalis]|uniref:GGDEF domain-containing protein n=1 Tax=Malaciobacter canalis TaxID=1912871 RepID=A0ABX4LPN0_9BACT|nr:hypothetical protein [Malaciobacter canalis]PHO09598.1 hypothetical protein CPG37_08845 [Malaciobacter canalis]QEE31666.1 hypothetical protein ACAN_0130 [Malaciobacter canalis]